jgi:hypothetical protein
MAVKRCQRCKKTDAIKGERFCKDCKKDMLRELKESGYLQNVSGTSPKAQSTFNDQRGRAARSSELLSGTADWQTDGDEW